MYKFSLWLLITYFVCIVLSQMLGPADLIFKRIEHCEPKVNTLDLWIETRKYNRSVDVFRITVSNPWPVDEMVTLELKGWMKKEGGFKPGALYLKDAACVALEKILGDMFHTILNMLDIEDCPFPAGDYVIDDYNFDNKKFTVPQVWGEYKMEAFIYKEEELQGCYVAYYDMVEKEDDED